MSSIKPFRGLLYNKDKVGDFAKVTAPPYDVISPEFLKELSERHENNVVKIILPESDENDKTGDEKYGRAAKNLSAWLADGVLVQDHEPAIYYYTQEYEVDGKSLLRKGFIALKKLEEFGKGSVHPHEKTLSGPKADRLKLISACKTNLSQIFAIYSEPEGTVIKNLEGAAGGEPEIEVKDDTGTINRLWKVTDPLLLLEVCKAMDGRALYIADGHHRYETALNYRRLRREEEGLDSEGDDRPYDYIMMYLSSMEDEGMTILPTHRVVHSIKNFDADEVLIKLKEYFFVDEFFFTEDTENLARRRFLQKMEASEAFKSKETSFGLLVNGRMAYYILTLKDRAALDDILGDTVPVVYKELDVTILHSLILDELLGITIASQERQENIVYVKSFDAATESWKAGTGQLVFVMNPTKMEQIKAVAEAGLVMPQKSTYFYPKILTGFVMNTLSDEL